MGVTGKSEHFDSWQALVEYVASYYASVPSEV